MRVQRTIWGGKERGVEAFCDWIDQGFDGVKVPNPYSQWAWVASSVVFIGSFIVPGLGHASWIGIPVFGAAIGILAVLSALAGVTYLRNRLPEQEASLVKDAESAINELGLQRFCGRLKAHFTPEVAALLNEAALITLEVRQVAGSLSKKSENFDPSQTAIVEAARSVEFGMLRMFLSLNRGERTGNAVSVLHEMKDLQTEILRTHKRLGKAQGTSEDLRSRLQRLQDLREAEEEMDRMHASAGL